MYSLKSLSDLPKSAQEMIRERFNLAHTKETLVVDLWEGDNQLVDILRYCPVMPHLLRDAVSSPIIANYFLARELLDGIDDEKSEYLHSTAFEAIALLDAKEKEKYLISYLSELPCLFYGELMLAASEGEFYSPDYDLYWDDSYVIAVKKG